MSAEESALRHALYELCVQEAWMQARFLRAVHGGAARVLGDDFCGTAALSRAWVGMGSEYRAVAVDLDEGALAHARAMAGELGSDGERIEFRCADVRKVEDRADVIAALNFGACEFHEREALVAYLRNAHKRLSDGGVVVCDLYAGPGAWEEGETSASVETESGEVVYRWEQRAVNPLTGRVANAMHFSLPDGREIEEAFVYDWRLWGVPELVEAMREAGFARVECYDRYGEAMDGEGNLMVAPVDGTELTGERDVVLYVAGRAMEG